jgi:hypothetical protein
MWGGCKCSTDNSIHMPVGHEAKKERQKLLLDHPRSLSVRKAQRMGVGFAFTALVTMSMWQGALLGAPPDEDAMASIELLDSPDALQALIDDDTASLILFDDELELSSAESMWFETFASHIWRGPRISFGICNNVALRRAGRRGASGIYLFANTDSNAALQLPVNILSEGEAQAAFWWIQGALAAERVLHVDGAMRKALSAAEQSSSAQPSERAAGESGESQPASKEEL